MFENTHMRAIAPAGRHNVTDSYAQVQNMFSERARACSADDATCENNTINEGKDQGQSDNTDTSTDTTDNTNTNGGNQ